MAGGPKEYEPTSLSQTSNTDMIVKKGKSKPGFQGKSRFYQIQFFFERRASHKKYI